MRSSEASRSQLGASPPRRAGRPVSACRTRAIRAVSYLAVLILSVPMIAAAEPTVGTVASVQNQVETRRRATAAWSGSKRDEVLYALDRVRTGPQSRAAILYPDRTLQRMDQRSEIEIQPPVADQPGILRVLTGNHYFSSRTPKQFRRIETPTVNAYVKGTEFVVEVGTDTTTKITMLEGTVEASNSFGTLTVQKGEQAYVEPGKAPVKRIVIRPRDAVAWALYYPPVLGGADAERLKGQGTDGESLARAAAALGTGQVEDARRLIEDVLARKPQDPIALALASVTHVAANETDEARRLAEQAVAAAPDSAAAALALSFASQAGFDIPRARAMAEKAAELDPASSVALARAAELRLAEGDLAGAAGAAGEAVKRTPDDARALSVLGFAELTRANSKEAERLFDQAAASDSGLSLARLGLGIARIRRGRVSEGREELQIATALDPDDSLLRSYLGKALYEEKLNEDAAKELAAAKDLDPLDPTPYLYDAIRKQNENRPVEALEDLRASIARNDNRAVYRSRLLLDQDRAVRASDLARIYNDLGFNQLGLVTARRSADDDQANYSSHLFLSGNYREVPDFAPALFSEILQARIYQPVSVNAARPDVVNATSSLNEYTALFDRPRIRGFGEIAYLQTNSDLEGLSGSNQGLVGLDSSDGWFGTVTGTINRDRFSGAVSYQKIDDDGFRFNNDRTIVNYRGFFEWAPTFRDSFQLNALLGRQATGDLPLRLFPANLTNERIDSKLWNLGLGYHRLVSPSADLAVSFIYNKTRQDNTGFDCDPAVSPCEPILSGTVKSAILEGPQLEAQYVWRRNRMTWIFGAGGFDGDVKLSATSVEGLEADDQALNAYVYLGYRPLPEIDLTVGASGEHVVAPAGLLTPRDAGIGAAELTFSETRLSPKLGVTVRPVPRTTLRAVSFYRLSPAIGRIQTLEPTQVAGFNQFFFEPGGTRTRAWGVGFDQDFGAGVFAGAQFLRRRLDIPEAACVDPDRFSGCSGLTATEIDGKFSRNVDISAYLNTVLTSRATFGVDYSYATRDFNVTRVNNEADFTAPNKQDYGKTWRLGPGLKYFWPSGLFAAAKATWYNQTIEEFSDYRSDERRSSSIDFWLVDVAAGYRLPKRYGSIILEARNASDQEFEFFDRAVEETVIPARTVTLRLNITY